MKTIELAKLSRFELATILFAARWQMQDWKKASNNTDIWNEAIEATKYIERYMKDYEKKYYYIQTFENEL